MSQIYFWHLQQTQSRFSNIFNNVSTTKEKVNLFVWASEKKQFRVFHFVYIFVTYVIEWSTCHGFVCESINDKSKQLICYQKFLLYARKRLVTHQRFCFNRFQWLKVRMKRCKAEWNQLKQMKRANQLYLLHYHISTRFVLYRQRAPNIGTTCDNCSHCFNQL